MRAIVTAFLATSLPYPIDDPAPAGASDNAGPLTACPSG